MLVEPTSPSQVLSQPLEFSQTRTRSSEICIELPEISALNSIQLQYKTMATISISISKFRQSERVAIFSDAILSHGRDRRFPLGSIPAKFIWINFSAGTPLSLQK